MSQCQCPLCPRKFLEKEKLQTRTNRVREDEKLSNSNKKGGNE